MAKFDSILGKLTDGKVKIKDVKGLTETLSSIQTELHTIVHAFTIDFQESREVVQMRNMVGACTLTKVITDNVSVLELSINGSVQTLTLNSGSWTGEIQLPAQALLVWHIERTTEGNIAEINAEYQYNE